MPDISPARPPCPKCGAAWTLEPGKTASGWILIHLPDRRCLMPEIDISKPRKPEP